MAKHKNDFDDVSETDDFAVIDSLHEKTKFSPASGNSRRLLFGGIAAAVVAAGVGAFVFLGGSDDSKPVEASGECADLQGFIDSATLGEWKKFEWPSEAPGDLRIKAQEAAEDLRILSAKDGFNEEVSRAVLSTAIAFDTVGAAILADDPDALADAVETATASGKASVEACAAG